jgi:glutathione S-transferase
VVAAQDERIAEALSILNDQLEHNEFLLGDKLSACDYFLFMLAEWSLPIQKSPMTFKHLAKYLQRLAENPIVKEVCEIEGIDLTPFQMH